MLGQKSPLSLPKSKKAKSLIMEIRDLFRITRKYWILVLVLTLLGVAVGIGYTYIAKPKYRAQTELYVSVQSTTQGTAELAQGSNYARQAILSYQRVVTTDSVLTPVIDELGLSMTPQELAAELKVTVPTNTTILQIQATDDDAKRAALIANEVGNKFSNLARAELEGQVGGGESEVKITQIESAQIPEKQVSPSLKLDLLLGLIAGLMIGFGAAVVRDALDTRIHSVSDVEEVSDLPVLGVIPDAQNDNETALVVENDPQGVRSEAYRALRTNVQFLTVNTLVSQAGAAQPRHSARAGSLREEHLGKVFVLTSAGPGDGKTTTSTNLATALAQFGAKVALIDADLRRPSVAEYMGIEGGAGLSDVLVGRADIADVVQPWGNDELSVLPSGKIPPNPSELVGSTEMEKLVHELRAHFDYVIIDSPPVMAATDAILVSKVSDGVILVVSCGKSRKPEVDQCIHRLETADVQIRGLVVNRHPNNGLESYIYGGRYGYSSK